MNSKQIQTIRDSLGKVVRMLTSRSIKVTQRGMQAYVSYHPKTGAIIGMNIPYLPDDASDEFVASIQGFVDHEVGHVLYSSSETLRKAAKLGSRTMGVANIIEDVYVERKMAEGFSGSIANLNELRGFFLNKMVLPQARKMLAEGNPEAATASMIVVAMRAWGGQTAAIDAMRANPDLAALTDPIKAKLGEDIIKQIAKCNSSDECLALAKRVVKALEPAEKKPEAPMGKTAGSHDEPPVSERPGRADPAPEPHADEDAGDLPDDEDRVPPEDSGTVSAETDEGTGSGSTELEGTESGTAGSGETPPGEEVETDAPEEAPTEEATPEPESAPPSAASPAADGDSGASETPAADDDEMDGPEGIGTPGASTDSDDATESSGAPGSMDDSAGTDEPVASPAPVEESGGDPVSARDEVEEDIGSVFEDVKDFDEEVSKALTDAARSEITEANYAVFSTDWDRIEPAPMASSSRSVARMVEETQSMISTMQKSLERAFAAQDKVSWSAGQRRGRIAPGSLFKVATGDDRVFRKRYETQARNTALSLLIDCSGSMNWEDRIGTAGKAAFALSQTLERLRLRHEVIGFTTRMCPELRKAMVKEEEDTGVRMNYGRGESLYMPVFKGFDERLGPDQISRIAHLTENVDWLRENVDGESVQIAGARLMQQRAERHVLIVLSDGSPACPPGHGLQPHLRKVVKDLESAGVEVVGVGINTTVVTKFYSRSVVLDDLSALPTEVMGQLTRVLLS